MNLTFSLAVGQQSIALRGVLIDGQKYTKISLGQDEEREARDSKLDAVRHRRMQLMTCRATQDRTVNHTSMQSSLVSFLQLDFYFQQAGLWLHA